MPSFEEIRSLHGLSLKLWALSRPYLFNMGVGSSDVTTFLLTPVKKYLFCEILQYLHRSRVDSVGAARYTVHFSLCFWLSSFSYYRKYVGQSGILRRFGRIIILKLFSRNLSNCQVYLLLCLTCARNVCLSLFELCHIIWKHICFCNEESLPSFTPMVKCQHFQISTKCTIFRPVLCFEKAFWHNNIIWQFDIINRT